MDTTLKTIIPINSIDAFNVSSKENNDANNNTRETIINDIINNSIPQEYFTISERWNTLNLELDKYIQSLVDEDIIITNIECKQMGGRGYNYDFLIIINKTLRFNIEFKFNASKISHTPQFVSLMKPSQYMSRSFEKYFYDNYLPKIAAFGELNIPPKEEYLHELHQIAPPCMSKFTQLYDEGKPKKKKSEKGCAFYKYSKKESKTAIYSFLQNTTLKSDILSNYLSQSQKHKVYMLYKDGTIYKETLPDELYKIKPHSVVVKGPNFICETVAGYKLKILLRWKNGNGIAFPAFQISRHIPNVTDLKQLCLTHNLELNKKKRKADIQDLLDSNKIIY